MNKKTLAVAIVSLSLIIAPLATSALTVDDIQAQIKALLSRVAALQLQLKTGAGVQISPADTATTPAASKHRICSALNRNLSQGAQGDDVRGLQEFLSGEGYLSANATGYFGPMTAQAVAKWQTSEGVSAVGAFGPVSRERIRIWCGGGGPIACTKEYAPVCGRPAGCEDICRGVGPCPMMTTAMCKLPSPQTYGNLCTLRAAGAEYLYDGVCRSDGTNQPPVISGLSGPTTLDVNATGTWTISASDPENQQLTYGVTWGDEFQNSSNAGSGTASAREVFNQTTTFTHAYASAGAYTIVIVVTDAGGQQTKTSSTVRVGNKPVACTMQYDPVCGQPPEPACRRSIPACMMATPGPQTYGNRCMMNAADAAFLYASECRSY